MGTKWLVILILLFLFTVLTNINIEFRKKPKSILCATDVAARGISMKKKSPNNISPQLKILKY